MPQLWHCSRRAAAAQTGALHPQRATNSTNRRRKPAILKPKHNTRHQTKGGAGEDKELKFSLGLVLLFVGWYGANIYFNM